MAESWLLRVFSPIWLRLVIFTFLPLPDHHKENTMFPIPTPPAKLSKNNSNRMDNIETR